MPERSTHHRADIQGLRAVASLLVACYHVWPGGVSGGVDVFFVITGFLVVPGMVDAIARRGARGAGSAIARAMLRQLPMAGVVLVAVAIAVLLLWPTGLRGPLLLDVIASAMWWENWLLVERSTRYIAAGVLPSPLQHMWATSVHVQVLVAFAVIVLVASIVARRVRRPRLVVAVVATTTVLSFWWASIHVLVAPDAAYFDAAARAWEIGVGALAGIAARSVVLSTTVGSMLGIAGIALVLVAGPLSPLGDSPGVITLVPVAGATCLLLAGTTPTGVVARALAWRPLAWLGGLAWGTYLWCWPLLIVWRLIAPDRASLHAVVDGVAIIAAAIAASWASTRIIAAVDRVARWRPSRLATPLAVAAAGALLLAGLATPPPGPTPSFQTVADVQRAIDDTIATGTFDGTERLGDSSLAAAWMLDDCLDVDAESADRCAYGPVDAAIEIAVVGDSHALAWLPGLTAALPHARFQLLTAGQCPFSNVSALTDGQTWQRCQDHVAWATSMILDGPPDLVVVAGGLHYIGDVTADGTSRLDPSLAMRAFADGTVDRLRPLLEADIPALWLDGPMPNVATASCAAPIAIEPRVDRCTIDGSSHLAGRFGAFSAAAAGIDGLELVDQRPWWCSATDGRCPVTIAGVPVTADGSHISSELSRALAPLLEPELLAALRR